MYAPDLDSPSPARARSRCPGAARLGLLAALSLSLVAPPAPASALEVSGVAFESARLVDGRPLALSGLGLHRYRVFIKIYAMALYLDPAERSAGVPSADRVLAPDVRKRLELETFWAIPAGIFRRMTRDRIERGVSSETYARISPQVEALVALYEDVRPGDRYAISYVPGVGTELTKNDVTMGVIEGEEFSRAMFGIWLGEVPFDRKLREQLLEARR